jgi:hypothetical protein
VQFRTVQTLNEVIHNLLHFHNELCRDNRIVTRLSLFRYWFHVPLLGAFGPGKIIGHVKLASQEICPLSADEYIEQATVLDNFDPVPTLRNWFRPVSEDEAFRLRLELDYFLNRYGREPNSMIYMYVLKTKGPY